MKNILVPYYNMLFGEVYLNKYQVVDVFIVSRKKNGVL